jgi:hypothetical protein
MPWGKSLYVDTGNRLNALEIHLDANNTISSVNVYGVFEQLGAAPFRGPSRSPPPAPDREGGARQVMAGAWSGTSGQPPWIRGQDLLGSIFPYRSRATR